MTEDEPPAAPAVTSQADIDATLYSKGKAVESEAVESTGCGIAEPDTRARLAASSPLIPLAPSRIRRLLSQGPVPAWKQASRAFDAAEGLSSGNAKRMARMDLEKARLPQQVTTRQ